jgi:hypothetical protein
MVVKSLREDPAEASSSGVNEDELISRLTSCQR